MAINQNRRPEQTNTRAKSVVCKHNAVHNQLRVHLLMNDDDDDDDGYLRGVSFGQTLANQTKNVIVLWN